MTNPNTTYKRLGDYIREVDVRNSNDLLDENDLFGVSVNKEFIPTHANLVGVQFHNYKIVKNRQFTYISDTSRRGDKIALALNLFGKNIIVSNVYTTFEVDEDHLLPEYLMMWFRRPEFDRYARFKSHGSAREVFDWEEMCNVMLPVPSLDEQQRIVDRYNAIKNRIETNKQTIAKLEEAAQALYRKMFVDNIDPENLPEGWRMGTISDLGEVVGGATPSTTEKAFWVDNGIKWLSPMDLSHSGLHFIFDSQKHITQEAYDSCSTKLLPAFSVLFSSRAPIGLTAISTCEMCTNQGFKSIIPKNEIQYPFVYLTLLNEREKMDAENSGSTFNEVSTKYMESYIVVVPEINTIKKFNKLVLPLFSHIGNVEKENEILTELLSMVMAGR